MPLRQNNGAADAGGDALQPRRGPGARCRRRDHGGRTRPHPAAIPRGGLTMLDEPTRRRPDFLPGGPIRLADGQDWTFPAPGEAADFGPDYAALVAAIDEAEDPAERLRAELALAIL